MNFNNYKAVIFDFDGTLVDSMKLWHKIDIDYLKRFGQRCPEHLSRDISGKSFTETAIYFKERFAIPHTIEEIKQHWYDMSYDAYLHDIVFKPGAYAFVHKLHREGMPLGIATSNTRKITESYLEKHDVLKCFSTLCFTNEVGVGKPDPAVFLESAKNLQVDPAHCLVFEDTKEGLLGAQSAGMARIAVADTFQDTTSVKALSDAFIEDYTHYLKEDIFL